MCVTNRLLSSGPRAFMGDRRSPDSVFEGVMDQRELRIHLLEPGILLLKFLDAFELTHREPAILGLPLDGRCPIA